MIHFKRPFKKLEFKRKYAYITLNDGRIIKHPISQVELMMDFRHVIEDHDELIYPSFVGDHISSEFSEEGIPYMERAEN